MWVTCQNMRNMGQRTLWSFNLTVTTRWMCGFAPERSRLFGDAFWSCYSLHSLSNIDACEKHEDCASEWLWNNCVPWVYDCSDTRNRPEIDRTLVEKTVNIFVPPLVCVPGRFWCFSKWPVKEKMSNMVEPSENIEGGVAQTARPWFRGLSTSSPGEYHQSTIGTLLLAICSRPRCYSKWVTWSKNE